MAMDITEMLKKIAANYDAVEVGLDQGCSKLVVWSKSRDCVGEM